LISALLVALAAFAPAANAASGVHKIKHVVIIMQENRSFDSYFGMFPGADGIPMRHGKPAACIRDPLRNTCVRPYHDHHDINYGGPHENMAFATDLDFGQMDGFIRSRETCANGVENVIDPLDCEAKLRPDMMGYHDAREIPNYWAYARSFVLQDHMFEPVAPGACPRTCSWSRSGLPAARAPTR
jgi:phospholipase C